MPEHLRALVVILVLAAVVFVFAKGPACALACAPADFERRRNLWFGVTLAAFLAHDFWIYIVIVAVLLLLALGREPRKLALFFFLLLALPRISGSVPGLGVFNYLFDIDYLRLLALAVLLPAYLSLRGQPGVERFGRSLPDKLIAGYVVFDCILMLTYGNFTTTLRNGVFYAFVDVFLPYYVASRSLRSIQDFGDVLMSFVIAASVLSAILFVEFARGWLLYGSLERALGVSWGWSSYLLREGSLRALGTAGHAIVAGYVVAVAIGFSLYLRRVVPDAKIWGLGLALLLAGLIAPISRGPWVGAAAMLVMFVATGPSRTRAVARLAPLAVIAFPLLVVSGLGEKILEYLPFVGSIEARNVAFRQRLAETSFQVFLQNPFLGRYDYLETEAMQSLRGGDGMIDMVNTYAIVGLSRGLVGLSLFVGFFGTVAYRVYRGMQSLSDRNDERHVLGRALLATLLGIMLIIGTASPTLFIPVVYWCVAGLGVAYARMLTSETASEAAKPVKFQPASAKAAT
ncbi:MAG: O-antigen ligase family protein [Steroidobacteraceae bacterium]